MAWRDGFFDPPSGVSGPKPFAPVMTTENFGIAHFVVPADTTGANAADLNSIASLEDGMRGAGGNLLIAKEEAVRGGWLATLMQQRAGRTVMVHRVRTQLLENACLAQGNLWDPKTAQCTAPKPEPKPEPKDDAAGLSIWLGAGALALGTFWLYRRSQEGTASARSFAAAGWTME